MEPASIFALLGAACLTAASMFTVRAYAADGRPKGPVEQMRLLGRYVRGEASPRERGSLNAALAFTVLAVALLVVTFVIA